MSPDEQTAAFLRSASASSTPMEADIDLPTFRAEVEAYRNLGFPREDVARVRDLQIPVAPRLHVNARMYVPDTRRPPPVLVWAHGGSWVRVHVDLFDGHFRVMANRSGCAVVAVDYRLSPEAPFPAALEDVYAAGRFMRARSSELGCDPTRIGIGGESAGGNLAAAAALLDRSRDEVGFVHQALVLPVLDVGFDSPSWRTLGSGYLLTREQMEWALTQYAPGVDRRNPLLSPLCAEDLGGLPPALVVTGGLDPLQDDGRRYAEALRAEGVEVDHRHIGGLIHHATIAPAAIDRGRAVVEETSTAIGDALRGGEGLP